MIDKKEADAYQEAWLEAERAAIISKFQYSYPWEWGVDQNTESDSDVIVPVPTSLGESEKD